MSKIFIRKDSGAEATFLKGLYDTFSRGNQLISLFNENQPFQKIESMMSFTALVNDPVSFYDSILTENIQHDNRLNVDPGKLAELYGIPRNDYLIGLGFTPQQASKCHNCQDDTDLTVKLNTLSPEQFSEYSEFIFFKSGKLQINTQKVEEHKDGFNIYAESPEALRLVQHYESLCHTLNEAMEHHHNGGQSNLQTLAKMFGLKILENKLIPDNYMIAEQIKMKKYENL